MKTRTLKRYFFQTANAFGSCSTTLLLVNGRQWKNCLMRKMMRRGSGFVVGKGQNNRGLNKSEWGGRADCLFTYWFDHPGGARKVCLPEQMVDVTTLSPQCNCPTIGI